MNRKHINKFFLSSCVLVLLLWSGCFADSPGKLKTDSQVISDNLTIEQIRPNVWVYTSYHELQSGVRFPANGMLVQTGDELLMLDTAWGAEVTDQLLDWIDREIGLKVAAAVITHFHADRLAGSPVLTEREIPYWSSDLTRTLAADDAGPPPKSLPGLEQPGSVVSFKGLEIYYPGAAHSHDNVVVWIPDEKILFGGCAIRSPVYPGKGNSADGDVEQWPHSIKRVQQRYPHAEIVVPGHGPAASTDLLKHTISLFEVDQ